MCVCIYIHVCIYYVCMYIEAHTPPCDLKPFLRIFKGHGHFQQGEKKKKKFIRTFLSLNAREENGTTEGRDK